MCFLGGMIKLFLQFECTNLESFAKIQAGGSRICKKNASRT